MKYFIKKLILIEKKASNMNVNSNKIMVMAKINDASIHSWLCIMALGIEDHHG